jgi:cyclopropane-fatty-acyl-phospholipid synthase
MFPLNRLLRGFIKRGEMTVIDADGVRHRFAGDTDKGPDGDTLKPVILRIKDKSLYYKLVLNPELHAGEAYMDERVTLEDGSTIRDFLTLFSANRYSLNDQPLQKFIGNFKMLMRRYQQSNRRGEATKNVAHHYDLGNELYKLFLDKNLVYSCGYFIKPNDSLETAQRNKLRLLAAKLALKPGQRVLDIGSGWGDMALYLAQLEEVEVLGVTLSKEQQELSSERAHKMGLSNRVRFELRDYRDVTEKFDRVVSVGMFEHVGVHHYDEFFAKVNSMMPDDGVMMLHSIGHMSPPTTASPWYRKYIFPGGYAPALSEVFQSTERNHLWVTDIEFLRLHYAMTIAHWHKRFEKNREKIVKLYDERFARMWEFYLISAELMFRTGSQLVFQMQLSRTRDAVPIVRDYITDKQRAYAKEEKSLAIAL